MIRSDHRAVVAAWVAVLASFMPMHLVSADGEVESITVRTLADLQGLDAAAMTPGATREVMGFGSPGDGGGGVFWLDTSGALGPDAADGGVILSASGSERWYWRRVRADGAINLLWYGAKRDGSEDCAPLVRRAARHGDVYYPAGTYLQSHVDVASRRRYFGDGPGRTIIKRAPKGGHDRIVFGIATSDFEKSGRPTADVEHVAIEDLTLDFNLAGGWFNRPLIQFRSTPETAIRDVTIQRVHVIDSARTVHPNVFGKRGGDAWAIEVSAWNVERLTVQDCVSTAETHQFIAGGRTMRGVRYVNNEVHGGWANGISLTTVGFPARFEDIEISGNRIFGVGGGSIYLGYDYGHERPVGPMEFRDIRIRNNHIVIDGPRAYGHRIATTCFPSGIQIFAGPQGVQNLTITGNTLRIAEDYAGGDVNFLKLDRGDFLMKPARTVTAFEHPGGDASVRVEVAPARHAGQPWAVPGSVLAVEGGGHFQVVAGEGAQLELRAIDWLPGAAAGTPVPAGATVTSLGGIWGSVLIAGNTANARFLIGNSLFRDLTITGNLVNGAVRLTRTSVAALHVAGNSGLTFSAQGGSVAGSLSANLLRAGKTFARGAIQFEPGRDALTGFPERCQVAVVDNVLTSTAPGPANDVGIRVHGETSGVTLRDNVLTGSRVPLQVSPTPTAPPAPPALPGGGGGPGVPENGSQDLP